MLRAAVLAIALITAVALLSRLRRARHRLGQFPGPHRPEFPGPDVRRRAGDL